MIKWIRLEGSSAALPSYAAEGQVVLIKVLVCSDSHGAFSAAEALLQREGAIRHVIFLGDGAAEWEDLMLLYPEKSYYPVRGNCDFGSDWPAERVVELGGHRIFCTHGHLYGVKSGDLSALHRAASAQGCDIILYGHTHAARIDYADGVYCCNPGSLRYPNEGRPSWLELNLDGSNVVPILVEL